MLTPVPWKARAGARFCIEGKLVQVRLHMDVVQLEMATSDAARIALCTVAACGGLLTMLLVGWLYYFRQNTIVSVTKPKESAVALIGTLLVYSSTVWLALASDSTVACDLYTYTSQMGVSLIMAAISAKTWRVHHTIGNSESKNIATAINPPSERRVHRLIAGLIAVDGAILVVWQCIGPTIMTVVTGDERIEIRDGVPSLVVDSSQYCTTDYQLQMLMIVLLWKLVPSALCAYTSFGSRHVWHDLNEGNRVMVTVGATMIWGCGLFISHLSYSSPTRRMLELCILPAGYALVTQCILFGGLVGRTLCLKESTSETLDDTRRRRRTGASLSMQKTSRVTISEPSQVVSTQSAVENAARDRDP